MKKAINFLLLTVVLFSACRKETARVLDNPDERLTAVLKAYQDTLVSAPYGWKGAIYPTLSGAYSFYLKFTNDNMVSMISDINATYGGVAQQSTFRLKALQQPTLIFDTYNSLHMLADPNPAVMGGTRNKGLGSDIEFAFVSTTDSVKLQGLVNKTPFALVKATQEEASQYEAGKLKAFMLESEAYFKNNAYPYLEFTPGEKIQISISNKLIALSYIGDNEKVINLSTYFSYTLNGLDLKSPLKVGDQEFSKLFWDEVQKQFYVVVNNTRINVQNSPTPIVPFYMKFGKGKDYSVITVNPATLTGLSADFMSVYNTAKTGLAAVGNNAGRVLDYFSITFNDVQDMTLRVYYHNTANANFTATFLYKIVQTAPDKVKFTFVSRDNNANTAGPGIVALTNYLEQNEFKLDWAANLTPGSTALLGGFYKTANPASFFFGVLSK